MKIRLFLRLAKNVSITTGTEAHKIRILKLNRASNAAYV